MVLENTVKSSLGRPQNRCVHRLLKELNIISTTVRRITLKYFGHIIRRDSDNMEQLEVYSKVEGLTCRGRFATLLIEQIKDLIATLLQSIIRLTTYREKWRYIVHNIT